MDFEKTIMDLLKKYVEEHENKKEEKQDIEESASEVKNAENLASETEKTIKNNEIVTPKTESDVFADDEKVAAIVAGTNDVESKENTVTVQKEDEKEGVERNENINTDPEKDPTYRDVMPKDWQEVERLLNVVENSYTKIEPEKIETEAVVFERKEMPTETAEDVESAAREKIEAEKAEAEAKVVESLEAKAADAEAQKKNDREQICFKSGHNKYCLQRRPR